MAKNVVNISGRKQLIPLEHPEFQKKQWGWLRQVVRTTELHPRTGAVGVTERRRGFPGILTVLSNAIVENLPDAISSVPEVRNLVRRGLIRIEEAAAPAIARVVNDAVNEVAARAPRATNGKRKGEETK